MVTNKGTPAGLIEATQLTRAGRLLEATELIQRVLRRSSAPVEDADRQASVREGGASSDVIDVESSEVAALSDRVLTPLREGVADTSRRFSLKSFSESVARPRGPLPIKLEHVPTSSISRRVTRGNTSRSL